MPESPSLPEVFDVLVIGAGPTGLACAIEAQRAGFRAVLVDKGCLCNSLFHYPAHMTFFTTSELLEIGDIPFPSPNAKPTRNEALEYYRKVADALPARHPPLPARRSASPARTATSPSALATASAANIATPPAKSSSPPATTTCPT